MSRYTRAASRCCTRLPTARSKRRTMGPPPRCSELPPNTAAPRAPSSFSRFMSSRWAARQVADSLRPNTSSARGPLYEVGSSLTQRTLSCCRLGRCLSPSRPTRLSFSTMLCTSISRRRRRAPSPIEPCTGQCSCSGGPRLSIAQCSLRSDGESSATIFGYTTPSRGRVALLCAPMPRCVLLLWRHPSFSRCQTLPLGHQSKAFS
mmetsp:Transcript_30914/g.94679  ORF Transcript_30914/g.94679 Transcript_30914/m.94679 type:complete len:205 (-) Transcript_30914:480-1094(-)